MKIRTLLASLLCLCGATLSQTATARPAGYQPPRVDLRVETLGIVAMLAGYEEFTRTQDSLYHKEIVAHFTPHKDHPLIGFARRIRHENEIYYNAVPAMAVHLSQPPAFEPLVPFSVELPEERWTEKAATEFVRLLRDFYRDADCETFFAGQQEYYRKTEEALHPIFGQLDTEWFEGFFGTTAPGSLYPIIGIVQGRCNFGAELTWPDGTLDIFAVLGVWDVDDNRTPRIDEEEFLSTIVHEFAHAFVNPMNDRHTGGLQPAGEKIFAVQENVMRWQAYPDWQIMFYEALVRTIEVNYALAHDNPGQARSKIEEEFGLGFIWIEDLARFIEEKYVADREIYPDMESFMPQIIAFYNDLAADFPAYKARMEERYSQITNEN